MLDTIKSHTGQCNGKTRTVNIHYTEKNIQNSTYYVFEKSNYIRCEDCTFSDCPVYKSAPKQTQRIR